MEWQNHQQIAADVADTNTHCLWHKTCLKLGRLQRQCIIPTDVNQLTTTRTCLWAHPISHKYEDTADLQVLPAVLRVILPHVLDEVHLLQVFVPRRPRDMLRSAIIRQNPNTSVLWKTTQKKKEKPCQIYDQMAALACRTSDTGVEEGGGRRGLHATSQG